MKKNLKKVLLILVLLFTLTILFACDSSNKLNKVLECSADGCKNATVETSIKIDANEIYKEVDIYKANDNNGYDKIIDIETLLDIGEKGLPTRHEETTVDKVYSLVLLEEYLTDIELNEDGLKANINTTGALQLFGSEIENATIELKTSDGKVLGAIVSYNLDGQNVTIKAEYQY